MAKTSSWTVWGGYLDSSDPEGGSALDRPVSGGVTFEGERGVLSFAIGGGDRSVGGLTSGDIVGAGVRNYYELIIVDETDAAKIDAYDTANTDAGDSNLSVDVTKGHTYHILLLTGYKSGTDAPTLLASGFTSMTMYQNDSNISVPMTPLVVDVEFLSPAAYQGKEDGRHVGRLAKTVGLDTGTTYTMHVTLGSAQEGVKFANDALKKATGDGLAALKKAEKAVVASGGIQNWDGLEAPVELPVGSVCRAFMDERA